MAERASARRAEDPEAARTRVFAEHYPDGVMTPIAEDVVPPAVMERFEDRSAYLVHVDAYRPRNFVAYYAVTHANGEQSYVAERNPKTYAGGRPGVEREAYVVDVGTDGRVMGWGEIRYNITDPASYFKEKPLVGYTRTEPEFQRRGYGLRRLIVMNAMAHAFFGFPLHSDTVIRPEAERRWEDLVRTGRARKYKEGKYDRYRFIN
ncbi:MAG: hypothetical protein Q7R80_01800 [bacterium]|nr:hypothetical protein [bacterium]